MKKVLVGFSLLLAVLASSWSLLHPSFFRVHDYVHGARIGEMLLALQEGQFPVRWSANFGYGYGMPLYEFYAPLPYYVGAFWHWLGFDLVASIKLLYLMTAVGTALGAYKLGARMFGRSGGIFTAFCLTLAPYRAVNLFVRGALSESWAIMAMPWILLGILQIYRKEKTGFITLTLSLITLFLSHNVSTLIFLPFSLAFAVAIWFWERNKQLSIGRAIAQVGGAYLLALGSAAFYLLPSFAEKSFTQIDKILTGYFHYSQHFLYIRQFFSANWKYGGSSWGPQDDISFFLGAGQIIALIVLAVLLLRRAKTLSPKQFLRSRNGFYAVLLALLGLSLFMTLLKSQPIWDHIPLLHFVQFPWRYLSVAAVFIALLAGASVTLITHKMVRYLYVLLLGGVLLIGNTFFFRPESYLENTDSFYYSSPERIRSEMSSILPDYIPIQMASELTPPTEKYLVPGGTESKVEVLVDRGHQKLFRTTFTSPATFDLMVADFPGWQVELDGKTPLVKRLGQHGTIAADVPAGEHLLGFEFGSTPIRSLADTISAISGVILLGYVIFHHTESKQNNV